MAAQNGSDREAIVPSGLYMRTDALPSVTRAFRKEGHHPTTGMICLGCGEPLAAGALTTLVVIGPGGDEEARKKAAAGRFYNAVCVELHLSCATGQQASGAP